jgi:uncharacterized protein (TIGR04222 family)
MMTWNPFDWTADLFLTFYVSMAAIVFLAGLGLKMSIGSSAPAIRKLDALELAYLGGGARRVGDVALLNLMLAKAATIGSVDYRITVTGQTPFDTLMGRPTPLPVVHGMTRKGFQAVVKPLVDRIQSGLQELGYCPTDEQMMSFRTTIVPFVLILLGVGVIRAVVGAERHHPIGILVFFLILTVFAGIALAKRPTRTRAGADVLENYQASHTRASRAPRDHELVLAVALSGAEILSGTPYASVYAASKKMRGSDDGCGGCGGCDGGCGGCGGCD